MSCLDKLASPLLAAWILPALLVAPSSAQSPAHEQVHSDEPVEQPIPFSHQLHSSLKLDCEACHPGAREEAVAGLPGAEDCLQCHQSIATESDPIVKLKELASANEPIEWVQIYRVPYFVFFSHASHSSAGIECPACHGKVEQQEVLKREREMSMLFCVDCHKKQETSTECHLCHELSQ